MAIKMIDLSEYSKTSGTSFLIYGDSGSRKTRSIGTMPDGSTTLHISLDNGANSAANAMEDVGITASHKITVPANLKELSQTLIDLHTDKNFIKNVDTIVVDNLISITEWLKHFLMSSKKFKADMYSVEDAADNSDKNAQGSKTLAFYNELQKLTKDVVNQLLTLKGKYNIVLLAQQRDGVDASGTASMMPLFNGPKSTLPAVSLFDEVYRTSFKDDEFDNAEEIKTKFKIASYSDPMTGMRFFAKTRNIKNLEYLQANETPADFRVIFKEIGYINKKDR